MLKKRGFDSLTAKLTRQKGYDDALEFANLIGCGSDYNNDRQAKKDVIDPSGDAHSIKSGNKKWQIFLYSLNRFESYYGFTTLNGIGDLLVGCIKSFPKSYLEYISNKAESKQKCSIPMREICNRLQDRKRLKSFFSKSIFNGGEVNYLTIKENSFFHVFLNKDVIDCLGENIIVENSKARNANQFDCQKVLFKYKGVNLAELEMRNDSIVHYREIRFNMYKARAVSLLLEIYKDPKPKIYKDKILIYNNAIKKFARW